MVRDNLEKVRERIKNACLKAGRNPEEVGLIAVSKTKPVEALMEAYEAGVRDFGENRVQEMLEKMEAMPKDIRWHMIGHLQTNKVKYIIGRCELIHSVDSLKLAETIHRESVKREVVTPVLLEINMGGEDTKFGVRKMEDAIGLVRQCGELSGISVRGLMTVPPPVSDPEDNAVFFEALRQLAVDIGTKSIDNVNMDILSMGMSGDFETAIGHGATLVRVGSLIFGERDYTLSI